MNVYEYITQDELHVKWFIKGYKAYRNLNCHDISIMIYDLKNLGKTDTWIIRLCEATYIITSNKTFVII